MQHVYPSNMSLSSTMMWICHYTDITSNIQQGFGSATEPRCPHVCIGTCYSSSFPPRNSGKCRLAALNFWVLGYCESLVILANATLEETFPGGVYLPMFWKRFVTATAGCVMRFILRDIEGYWGWLLKELLLVFPHLSVGESAAALHQLNEFFLAIIYLVETCADSSCREIVREQAAEPGKSEGRKGRKLPWLVVFRCLSLLLLDWRPENGMIIPCLTFIQGGAPAC